MKRVKIKVVHKAYFHALSEEYENEKGDCMVNDGDEWISQEALMPQGFCESAWQNIQPYVFALSSGGGGFFGDWMKNPNSAVISCNDGIRPVSFLLETID